jgi:pimeloyl-ACP methyl ester carboxylesterase
MSSPTIVPNKTHYIPSTSHTYAYLFLPPSSPSKPTLLILHGFPSTPHDYRFQIRHFYTLGYGILAPSLLGYPPTSCPLTVESYIGKFMAEEIIEILEHEGLEIGKVVGIAHDWGTYLLG